MTAASPPAAVSHRSAILRLAFGAFLISFSAVFVKLAHVGPTASAFYRQFFGGIVLLAVALARRQSLWKGRRPLAFAVVAGLFFSADLFCWHRSIEFIGPGLATIMGNFQVFVMAFVGVAVFKEKATWRFAMSIPLAIVGLFLLVGLDWSHVGTLYHAGVWFGLATAVTYAGYLLTLRRSQSESVRLAAFPNLAIITLITAGLLGISNGVEGHSLAIPDGQTWVSLVAYGVFCQALGWIVISRALPHVDASRAGLILLLQPALTFIWDVLFFDRPTTYIEVFGALLALGAIYLGNTAKKDTAKAA